MEKKKLPPPPTELKSYQHLPCQVRALCLKKDMVLGDVHWSGFFECAAVLLSQGVKRDQFKQATAKPGDYLIFREDNKGWERVMTHEEFHSCYAPCYDPAEEP